MRGFVEISAFVAIAILVHIALWPVDPLDEGASAAGAGGENMVTIAASSAAIEQLVEDFDRPPPAATAPVDAPEPSEIETPEAPDIALSLPAPSARGQAALPSLAEPTAMTPPVAPDAPPPPPPPLETREPEPEITEAEPVPEPEPEPEPTQLTDTIRPPQRPEPPTAEAEPEEPAETQPAQSTAVAGQRARGEGGGASAGRTGSAQTATLSRAARNSLRAEWGGRIFAQIARRGPRGNGEVYVRLQIRRDGALVGARVVRSSGNQRFDQAAIRAIRQAGRFQAAPDRLPGSVHTFDLPIRSR